MTVHISNDREKKKKKKKKVIMKKTNVVGLGFCCSSEASGS
jgi:hypothetical protein